MKKLTKNYKNGLSKIDGRKLYSLEEASELVKEVTYTKFDASIDIAVRLGVDPRKSEQMVRGVVTLPNGIGKTVKVLALVTPEKEQEAKDSGADYVGMDDYLQKIKSGWVDVDVIVTMPSIMVKLGPLGRVLGPRGLMPNPKTGTVTNDIGKAVSEIKGGKINFKVDKTSIIHSTVGRKSFSAKKISENIMEFMEMILRLKPSTAKGNYIKTIYLSGTMSPSIPIDVKQFS